MSKTCLVIGVGDGLGASLVKRFAHGGFKVAFIARRVDKITAFEEKFRAEGLDVRGFRADASDAAELASVISTISEQLSAPEVMIYNAAIVEKGGLLDTQLEAIRRSVEVNALGAVYAARAVLPAMQEAARGTILISNGSAAFSPHRGWGELAVGKAALRSIGLSLAQEAAPFGVRVGSVFIHGSIQHDPFFAADRIADMYWSLYQTPTEKFESEVHFKK